MKALQQTNTSNSGISSMLYVRQMMSNRKWYVLTAALKEHTHRNPLTHGLCVYRRGKILFNVNKKETGT